MQVTKDLPYLPFEDPVIKETLLDMVSHKELHACLISAMPLYVQTRRGVQMRVEKALTDELQETDLKDIGAEDIRLMFPSMEIYFEDPALPTCLFYAKDPDFQERVRKYLSPVQIEFGCKDSICLDYYAGVYNYTIQLPPAMMTSWLKEELAEGPIIPGFDKTTPEEEAYKRFLFRLIAKILLYASIPEYVPVEITGEEKKHRKWGKPGFKHRPETKVYKVKAPARVPFTPVYRIDTDDVEGHRVVPHRRRGHIRRLISEKYVNKRGQIIFVRPCLIHGGSLDDRIYIIRNRTDDHTCKVQPEYAGEV